jgi:hypothetical protein
MKKLVGFVILVFLSLGANVSNIRRIPGDGILVQARDGSSTMISNKVVPVYFGTNPEPGGSSPFQLLDGHKRTQRIVPTGAITIKMPTTNIGFGDLWTIYNDASQEVTIQSSGANQIDIINKGFIKLMAQVANPTAAADWKVLEVQEGQSATASFTSGFTGTPTAAVLIKRVNTLVQVTMAAFGGTCNGSSSLSTGAGVLPARYRPTNDQPTYMVAIQNNGAGSASPGMARVYADGSINVFRDGLATAFTNAAACGVFRDSLWMYDPASTN